MIPMNPEQLLARLKSLTGELTRAQLASLAGAFVLVVGLVIGSAFWINRPSYALLFADMDPQAAAQVVERLTADNVPYQLDAGGRSVRVDKGRVDELRLLFASQGLPASGRIGFELFDRTQFGQTEFLEQVNYRRALEGEIARTIATIDEVADARVHIAMGKDSLFTERAEPAKASVILKLRSNRAIPHAAIVGITNLVASSVEGLRPEAVVVLDTNGRPLARPVEGEDEPLGGPALERQQKLEKELANRVTALIEPVVGADHVRVNVALALRSDSEEQTEEIYDPDTPVIRSRQTTADLGAGSAAGGIAGARGNLPPPAQTSTTPGAPPIVPPNASAVTIAGVTPASRTAETTNYEISKTVRHTVRPRGDIARMSVAVILDHQQVREVGADGVVKVVARPRETTELQKIQALVSAAVGFDAERGDQLTVENISFSTPFPEEPPPPGLLERFGPAGRQVGVIAGIAILVLIVIVAAIRWMVKRRRASHPGSDEPALPQVVQVPKTVAELEVEIEQELIAAANEAVADKRRLPVLTKRLAGMTTSDPQAAARLIRSWLAEDKR